MQLEGYTHQSYLKVTGFFLVQDPSLFHLSLLPVFVIIDRDQTPGFSS